MQSFVEDLSQAPVRQSSINVASLARPEQKATEIQRLLEDIYARLSADLSGNTASYIPELAQVDPDDFGIVLCTVDGRIYEVGESRKLFTIQSISKPFAYGLALQSLGLEWMQSKVGVEPSGEAFNAISLDPVSGTPRNPMINAGAIATTAQVWRAHTSRAEEILLSFFSGFAGRPLSIDERVYASERDTGHRNRAIAHLLRNVNVIETEPEQGLDLYFRQCAIQVNCRDLAVMAACLACQGRNPLSGESLMEADHVIRLLALMGTCGMYDYAGQWLHDVGIPAKSGVGGGVLAVVPGRLGIGIFSPRLDPFGNSVRGIAVCQELSQHLGLHLYNQNPLAFTTIRRHYSGAERHSRRWRSADQQARLAQVATTIQVVHAQGVLDFAAMEHLLAELESLPPHTNVLVLDFNQVLQLPQVSSRLLLSQLALLASQGIQTLMSRANHLQGLTAQAPDLEQLDSLDRALERAEDLVLQVLPPQQESPGLVPPPMLAAFSPEDRRLLETLMELKTYQPGERVLRKGERSDGLYFVADGQFSVLSRKSGQDANPSSSRLATLTAGMCFGEIGFLSGRPRSADVEADGLSHCWMLSRQMLDRLYESQLDLWVRVVLRVSGELEEKLIRSTDQYVAQEEDQ